MSCTFAGIAIDSVDFGQVTDFVAVASAAATSSLTAVRTSSSAAAGKPSIASTAATASTTIELQHFAITIARAFIVAIGTATIIDWLFAARLACFFRFPFYFQCSRITILNYILY